MHHRALPIVAFSHLRWDWVYQRPQHLLGRLARSRPVFYIEEPVFDPNAGDGALDQDEPQPGVHVVRPRTAVSEAGFSPAQNQALRAPLQAFARSNGIGPCVAWVYTPRATPLVRTLPAQTVVYDCMDELSAFKDAPADLLARESELFELADLVFTGGPSLFEAKRRRHPRVHCFPSSVDAAHFGCARDGADGSAAEPDDQAHLPRPRLGYYGVIDERIDLPLLASLAAAHPNWQIVMVGPVAKIDPRDLPRAANIHYFGQRPYETLPDYLRGWDVCLLPFARNDATRYISPTKTLEYMVAEKPIVSTPIHDVAAPYGGIVRLGGDAAAFIAACEAALAQSPDEHERRVHAMRKVLSRTSWDATVSRMAALLDASMQAQRRDAPPGPTRARPRAAHELVIIGAGPTGLSAAYHAGPDCVLLEANAQVGGWCRSLEVNGFTFDFAGHIMFSNDPYVHEMYARLLGDNVHWQDREAWIYSKGVYTRYPFQGSLYGLPPEVIRECIVGAVTARFEATSPPTPARRADGAATRAVNGNGRAAYKAAGLAERLDRAEAGLSRSGGSAGEPRAGCQRRAAGGPAGLERARDDGGAIEDCCADGLLESTARLAPAGGDQTNARGNGRGAGEPANFEEFIYRVWGAGIARHFAIPYNRKLWAVPLTEMETSWLGGRVPMPDLEEMIDGALRPSPKPMGPNARFGYPLRGGFQALMNGFLPHVADRLRLNAAVTAVCPSRRTVTVNGVEEISYENLISTMPLPVLVRIMGDEAPAHVRAAAERLRYVSVRCVHLGVGREALTDKHWIYYPEDTVFHRIFVQGNASPHCNPPGGFGLTCEITYSPSKPLPCDGDALVRRCIGDCVRVGLFNREDPVWAAVQCDLPHAYVVYDHDRAGNVRIIRQWLAERGIRLAGRYSEWEYYNSDHAFLAGKQAVEALRVRPPVTGTPVG